MLDLLTGVMVVVVEIEGSLVLVDKEEAVEAVAVVDQEYLDLWETGVKEEV